MRHHLTGSKKKAKAVDRAARIDRAFKRRLARIYELSQCIRDEAELDHILNQIPDDEVRAETRKLITPFVLFSVGGQAETDAMPPPARTIVLTDAPAEVLH